MAFPSRYALLSGTIIVAISLAVFLRSPNPSGIDVATSVPVDRNGEATHAKTPEMSASIARSALGEQAQAASSVPMLTARSSNYQDSSLPPDTMLAASVVALLTSRAESGDTRAACRIGVELDRCRQQKLGSALAGSEAHCKGVTDEQTRSAARYLLQSALAGNTAAATLYATAPPMSETAFTDQLDDWRDFRDHAPTLLLNAVQAGDVSALYYAYFQAVGGPRTGGVTMVPHDPIVALTYAGALRTLLTGDALTKIESRIAKLSVGLDPAKVSAALAEGARLRQTSFARTAVVTEIQYGVPHAEICN